MSGRSKLVIQQLLTRTHWDIHRGVPLAIHRQAVLRRLSQVSVLDVGANEGLYAEAMRTAGFTGSIYSFEPLPDAFSLLAARASVDPRWTAVNAACGEAAGRLEIHRSQNSVSSSILSMKPAHQESAPSSAYVGAAIPCDVITLDDYFGARDQSERFYLKMDVQGFEDRVLRGAKATLSRVDALETEISLTDLYEGQASWHELVGGLLDEFELADFRPGFRASDYRLLQADILLLRRAV
jgi:FkbM family methyltransferase